MQHISNGWGHNLQAALGRGAAIVTAATCTGGLAWFPWTEGWWADGWTDGRMVGHGWMGGWMNGWVGEWIDEKTDGRTDGWFGGQKDGMTESECRCHAFVCQPPRTSA